MTIFHVGRRFWPGAPPSRRLFAAQLKPDFSSGEAEKEPARRRRSGQAEAKYEFGDGAAYNLEVSQ